MLVVIAVLCILMSLLMPALRGAIESARSLSCLSNLRQIGIAFVNYGQDCQMWYPPSCDDKQRSYDDYLLSDYLGDAEAVFQCPVDMYERPKFLLSSGRGIRSYGLNDQLFVLSFMCNPQNGIPINRYIQSPAVTFMAVEWHRGVCGHPWYAATRGGTTDMYPESSFGFPAYHGSDSNYVFFDNHVAAVGAMELAIENLSIPFYYQWKKGQ